MSEGFRTTIRLDYDQHQKLHWLSNEMNISNASVMRKALSFFFSKKIADWDKLYFIEPRDDSFVVMCNTDGRDVKTFQSQDAAKDFIRKQPELFTGEPDFVLQLKDMICHWLHEGGISYDLGSGKRNASTTLGEIPMKFTAPRGDER